MNMNNIQTLVEAFITQWQRERAETQLTLGDLIAALEAMPSDAQVANLDNEHSYRGYYSDFALEQCAGQRPAADLLASCRAAMGQVFKGYKGGDFVMDALTPVWVANYGCCGLKLLAIHAGGDIETSEDTYV
jgi:hypothetical protein